MAQLDKNISHYTHTGPKPCIQAMKSGVGISMPIRNPTLKNQEPQLILSCSSLVG